MLAQDDETRRQLGIAAAQGDSEAQFRLGAWHFAQGDFAEARRLFGLASAQGEAKAQFGLGVMHYSGMAAMRMPATLYYALDLFLASLVVAVGLGILSAYAYRLCRMENGKTRYQRYAFISALCISLAVSGMHYVAMQAAWFVPMSDAAPLNGLWVAR